jgi:hypothetical protein
MRDWGTDGPKPESVRVGDVVLKKGARVRLHPEGSNADIFDLLLDGKSAVIESLEQDFEGRIYLSVTVDDDPGRDLGAEGKPGHRFFFRPTEVEPLGLEGNVS